MPICAPANGAPWHTLPGLETARALHVDRASGLTADEAADRLAELGPNRFEAVQPPPRVRAFAGQYGDAPQLVLLAAAVASLVLGELQTAVAVVALTVVNAMIGLHREGRPDTAVAPLQRMLSDVTARVRRDRQQMRVPAEQVVPGDLVLVARGDVVPADGRLVDSAMLEADESILTGGRLPIAKSVQAIDDREAPLGDRTDMLYMGTTITRGSGELVVTATGMATEVGQVARLLERADDRATPLERGVARLTSQIIRLAAVALVVSAGVNLARGYESAHVALAAAAVAIAAVPIGLPLVIATVVSHGARALARAGAMVTRPRVVEALGATSAINADAASTLTLGEMTAVEVVVGGRRYAVSGFGYGGAGAILRVPGGPAASLEPVLLPMALTSDAIVLDGELIGDPIEGALVVLAEKGGIDVAGTRAAHRRIAMLPFDASYGLAATFHHMTADNGATVVRSFIRGAPDQLLTRAGSVLGADLRRVSADAAVRDESLAASARLARQGLHVLALGVRDIAPDTFDAGAELLAFVEDMTLLAFVGIVDPPRRDARRAIAAARSAGIPVRMVTADQAVKAEAAARRLGIAGRVVTGAELAAMDRDKARRALDVIGVVAQATPEHRARLVDTLRSQRLVVAATGGAIADAPAVAAANVGIATDGGNDVAKVAAGVVLAADGLSPIVRAVAVGREVYDGLLDAIRMRAATLAGLVLAFVGASVFDIATGLPFLPLQLLYLGLTTQVFLSVGMGRGRASERATMRRPPRSVAAAILTRRSASWPVTIGAVHAAVTLSVVAVAEHAHSLEMARTMGLTTFALMNVLFACAARGGERSVFNPETFADRAFLLACSASLAAIFLAAESHTLARMLETTDLAFGSWLVCCVAAATVLAPAELRRLVRRRVHPIQAMPPRRGALSVGSWRHRTYTDTRR
jgi:Ca2+-transporting ATPase